MRWWTAVLALELVAVAGTCLLYFASRGAGHALIARVGPRVGLTPERVDRVRTLIATRGRPMLLVGRGTPGLRTITVVAAGTSGIPARRAIPPLLVGATVFVQLHLALGVLLGPLARELFEEAKGVATVALVVIVVGAALFWIARRGRRRGAQSWCETACPLCLALSTAVDQTVAADTVTPADPRPA